MHNITLTHNPCNLIFVKIHLQTRSQLKQSQNTLHHESILQGHISPINQVSLANCIKDMTKEMDSILSFRALIQYIITSFTWGECTIRWSINNFSSSMTSCWLSSTIST